jgi:hypothetical protein
MISRAASRSISVFMNTNGTVLADNVGEVLDSGLTLICISLDGAGSRPAHAYDPDVPFEEVVRGVEKLVAAKHRGGYKSPQIHGKFIVMEDTIDEMEALSRWAADLGIEHVKFKRKIRTMPGQVERSQFVPISDLLRITEGTSVRSNEVLTFNAMGCSHPWDSLYLGANGHLGLCSWDPHLRIDLGKVPADFDSIWNGEPMRRVRRWHSGKDRSVADPCLTCNRLPGYLVPELASAKGSDGEP